MVDIVTAVGAGAVGLGLGGVASYYFFYSRSKPEKVVAARPDSEGRIVETTVTTADLDKSRREMRTIMVERDLLSSAMMKLYEAETEGRITREEREMISKRYSDQIKDLQSKLKDIELVVEVGELEGLRGELVTLFDQKIQNIEARLDAAKQMLGPAAPQPIKKEPAAKVDKEVDLEKVVEQRTRSELSESERRVREIRDEVMDALTKLEQIDIEKKQQQEN